MQEEIDDWNGIERRLACQGCSAVYSKLVRSEKFNSEAHKELYKLNYTKISKKNFIIMIIIVSIVFILNFKFRSDFELRYIQNLESANNKLQTVIYNLNDLITNIDAINKKITFTEEDIDVKIKKIQTNIENTKKALSNLQKKVNSEKGK